MNIYVGSLSPGVTEGDLESLFAKYGHVKSVKVLRDRYTGQPRGFGFVEMDNKKEATTAIEALNGYELQGRKLVVNEARPRQDSRRGFGKRRW